MGLSNLLVAMTVNCWIWNKGICRITKRATNKKESFGHDGTAYFQCIIINSFKFAQKGHSFIWIGVTVK